MMDKINLPTHNHHYYGVKYYKYNRTSFYFKRGDGQDLVCFFHGSISAKPHRDQKTPVPVFFGWNKKIAGNPDILCFSDSILEIYKHLCIELAWFQDTRTVNQTRSIEKILQWHTSRKDYRKVIFFGSSGGGYPAMLMACRLGGIGVVTNSQFYIHKHPQYEDLVASLQKEGDTLDGIPFLTKCSGRSGPGEIYNYCNTDDYTIHHHMPFMKQISATWPGRVKNFYFSGNRIAQEKNIRNHKVRFPDNAKPEDIIGSIIQGAGLRR